MHKIIRKTFLEHQLVLEKTLAINELKLINLARLISKIYKKNGKLIFCGNGGSAADSLHLSSEFIGKFKKKRVSLASVCLSSDVANITCISNDFGYEQVFSRQLEGIGKKNDLLICLTTSGNSKNIINCLKTSNKMKIKNVLFSGKSGGISKKYSNFDILVPSKTTARIQEMHILIGQLLCELVEKELKL